MRDKYEKIRSWIGLKNKRAWELKNKKVMFTTNLRKRKRN
jgi:hypothetical protein